MLLPVDEPGWTARGVQFLAFPGGYRFTFAPAPGLPIGTDALLAKDKTGSPLLTDGGSEQLDLQPDRYSPHRALLTLLGEPAA